MSFKTSGQVARVTVDVEGDNRRLALLWKAFEDAEERIRELERELDEGNARNTRERLREHETAVEIARTNHAESLAAIGRLEAEVRRIHTAADLAQRERDEAIQWRNAEVLRNEATQAAVRYEQEAARQARAELNLALAELQQQAARAQASRSQASERIAFLTAALEAAQEQAEESRRAFQADLADARRLERDNARGREEEMNARLRDMHALMADASRKRHALRVEAAIAQHTVRELRARVALLEADAATSRALLVAARRPVAPVRFVPIGAHPVARIPGVREAEVAALRAFGVNVTDTLVYADVVGLADATRISLPRLARLRAMAELMALPGVSPESARRLFVAGARSIEDVARMEARGVEQALRYGARGADRNPPRPDDVESVHAREIVAEAASASGRSDPVR